MNSTRRRVALVVPLLGGAILGAACGNGDDDAVDTTEAVVSATTGAATPAPSDADTPDEMDSGGPADTGSESDAVTDGSEVDWASIDLTTVDWATIDLSTVDFAAVEENPSIDDLDPATVTLIQERYAAEVAAGGGEAGSGEATLTIGADTWRFDGFVCAFGYQNTESDVFSFSSNAFGTLDDGTRTQLQANIWDETGSNSLTGPDTDHEVTFGDIDNFDDPKVDWLLTGPELTIDGVEVSVDGTFRSLSTGEEAEGSFTGECGVGSRF